MIARLVLLALLLPTLAAAQFPTRPSGPRFQNAGTNLPFRNTVNISTGCTATDSGGKVVVVCAGTGVPTTRTLTTTSPITIDGSAQTLDLSANRTLACALCALTSTTLTAGAGLTGGGDLSTGRTFTVGAGTGITVNADDVAIANTAVTPGSYTYSSLTVDQQGRLTAASNGAAPGDAVKASSNVFTGTTQTFVHIAGSGTKPTIVAGAGAGTGPTVSITDASSDLAGQINVTTGTGPTNNSIIATITFNAAHAAAPISVILTPANSATTSLSNVFIDPTQTTTAVFVVQANTIVALAGSTAYKWFYQVVQ